MIIVKLGRLNSESKEYSVTDDSTVESVLEIAGLRKKDTEIVTVNGEETDEEYELQDGDRVLLVRNVEGAYSA